MNARTLLISLTLAIGINFSAKAYDNGPQVLGCDFKFGAREGTDKCLIIGSGMGQGISWVVFEVNKKRYRYDSSSPKQLELLDSANKKIKTHSITNATEQCRPGGREADVYSFDNGDRICLYW